MSNLIGVKEAAELLGVSTKTIRRWEEEGKIRSIRTPGGHRRFSVSDLLGNKTDASLTLAYARVSSHDLAEGEALRGPRLRSSTRRGSGSLRDQKQDLKRQAIVLEAYCAKQGWSFELIKDLGSGLSYRKKGLIRLIKLICTHQVERLVISHKDRLLRFGSELIFMLCEIFGTEIIRINR